MTGTRLQLALALLALTAAPAPTRAQGADSCALPRARTVDTVTNYFGTTVAATLQAAQGGAAPILIRVETRAGHGGGMPTAKQIELAADRWAFLIRNLGMAVPSSQ